MADPTPSRPALAPFPARQITGNPFFYYGYVGRGDPRCKPLDHCCTTDGKPTMHKGYAEAMQCAAERARQVNIEDERTRAEAVARALKELVRVTDEAMCGRHSDEETEDATDEARAALAEWKKGK